MPEHYDVAIIGYGPTGATAANLLGQQGLKVLVIERDPDIYQRARAISTDVRVLVLDEPTSSLDLDEVAELLKRHPELARVRLVVEGELANDRMTLHAETSAAAEGLAAAIATSVREPTSSLTRVIAAKPSERQTSQSRCMYTTGCW